MTHTASPNKTTEYTQPKLCDGCKKLFYAKSTWNGVNVKCPRCSHIH